MEMELFAVTRYDTEAKHHDPEREKRILENLQKNINKKKKKVITETVKKEDAVSNDENPLDTVSENVVDIVQDENVDKKVEVEEEVADVVPTASPKTDDFMVLGDEAFQKKKKVEMILPHWLAYPTVISNDLSLSGQSLDSLNYLSTHLKTILEKMDIKKLFPVQEAVIPYIIEVHSKPQPFRPRDICVSAPTGSGKTLAYALPIVQLLQNRVDRKIRALIVLPVNELALQVLKVFLKLCENTNLSCALLTKFSSFETEQSMLVEEFEGKYYSKVDILVATSGRLVEHIHSTKGFSLKSLQFLVMDEADRIMEQIQNNWLYHLDAHVKEQSDTYLSGRQMPLCYSELCDINNRQPHKLLFSATLSQDPEKLQNSRLFQPKLFTAIVRNFNDKSSDNAIASNENSDMRGDFIGKYTTPAELTEKYLMVQPELKPLLLYTMIKENNWNRFLCFTNSGVTAHRLSFILQRMLINEMKIEELSSGLSPTVRANVLAKFHMSKINGIVCSDALARGIDIHGVDVVISYDAPRHAKTYIHRIGRTARAGKLGLAVTMLTHSEIRPFNNIIINSGKTQLEEIKLTSNLEIIKAKEYTQTVKDMQDALGAEAKIQTSKMIAHKSLQNPFGATLMAKIQSEVQAVRVVKVDNNLNVPESWKYENQQSIKSRKERKRKLDAQPNQSNVSKKIKTEKQIVKHRNTRDKKQSAKKI